MFWGSWPVNGRRHGTLQVCKRRQRKSRVRPLPIPAGVQCWGGGTRWYSAARKESLSVQTAFIPSCQQSTTARLPPRGPSLLGVGSIFGHHPNAESAAALCLLAVLQGHQSPSLMVRNISVSEICRMMMVRQEPSSYFGANQTCECVKWPAFPLKTRSSICFQLSRNS